MKIDYEACSDEELILLCRGNDNQALTRLLEKYKPFVKKRSRELFLTGGDQEDLLQEGMLGLFSAIREYDRDKGNGFFAYASVCVTNQMYKAIRTYNRKKHELLNTSVSLDEVEEGAGMNQSPIFRENPEQILLDQERTAQFLEEIHTALSSYENRVLDLYLDGMDYIQIASHLSKTAKSVDNALQRIRSKVLKILNKNN